ncbi:MAG: response regulator transcription factor [Propionibacteriaceae bacterium]|jgi:two-component system response regulator MtrA|nr:response regulator transcription factor [Propionibacteriaceae bacterium]
MSDSKGLRILVVEDDEALAEMLSIQLGAIGYEVRVCHRGDRAYREFAKFKPHLVLLDVMLPGRDGVDVCRDIRAESDVPIVMLTAKSDTVDVIRGLEAGADDYVFKPFKTDELVARIRARLRRQRPVDDREPLRIGDLTIYVPEHQVMRAGTEINLTPLEFDLLLTLARHPKKAFTREQLLEDVWDYHHAGDTRLVNVHVQRLRAKVEVDPENPEIVLTVRGVGYRAGAVKGAEA